MREIIYYLLLHLSVRVRTVSLPSSLFDIYLNMDVVNNVNTNEHVLKKNVRMIVFIDILPLRCPPRAQLGHEWPWYITSKISFI